MKAVSRAITKFCYNHPRFGIRRLMIYVVAVSAAVYLLTMMDSTGQMSFYLIYFPDFILRGEVWRIVTWIFLPTQGNILFVAISLYFYYFIGSALEAVWGPGKFTIFYLSGVILNIVAVTAMYYILRAAGLGIFSFTLIFNFNASFLNLSLFFAYASSFPENQLRLFFLIPIKVKWLGIANAALFLWQIGSYIVQGAWFLAVVPAVAVMNYLLIVGPPPIGRALNGMKMRNSYRNSAVTTRFKNIPNPRRGPQRIRIKKCAVCGKTDLSHPNEDFRYCTQCEDLSCYCEEHIHDHEHK